MSLDASNENTASQSAPRLPDVANNSQTANIESQSGAKESFTLAASQTKEVTPQDTVKNEARERQDPINPINTSQDDSNIDKKNVVGSTSFEETNTATIIQNSDTKQTNEAEEVPSFSVASLIANSPNPIHTSNSNNQPKVARTTIIRHQSQPNRLSQLNHRSHRQ